MVSPASPVAGQQFQESWTFKPDSQGHGKTGFLALLPGGTGQYFNVSIGDVGAWTSYLTAQGMLGSVPFTNATQINATFTAPAAPGPYEIQAIVPEDGGTDGVDAFTVVGAAGAGAPAGAGPQGGGQAGPIQTGGAGASWLTRSTLLRGTGIPDVAVVGLPLLLLLMRR